MSRSQSRTRPSTADNRTAAANYTETLKAAGVSPQVDLEIVAATPVFGESLDLAPLGRMLSQKLRGRMLKQMDDRPANAYPGATEAPANADPLTDHDVADTVAIALRERMVAAFGDINPECNVEDFETYYDSAAVYGRIWGDNTGVSFDDLNPFDDTDRVNLALALAFDEAFAQLQAWHNEVQSARTDRATSVIRRSVIRETYEADLSREQLEATVEDAIEDLEDRVWTEADR